MPRLVADIMATPEMQRLREIRLLNVNTCTLLGATSISRLEHAIGVAYLANVAGKTLHLTANEANNLIVAALIHDVAAYPFGHLVESIFRKSFSSPDHTERLLHSVFAEKETLAIYRGMPCRLFRTLLANRDKIGDNPVQVAGIVVGRPAIEQYLQEEGITLLDNAALTTIDRLHSLISGPVDLDNIDNVFRVAMSFGMRYREDTPVQLSQALVPGADGLRVREESASLLEEWLDARAQVYTQFYTNPDILSTKAILTYAVERAIQTKALTVEDWTKTDSEILDVLNNLNETAEYAHRIVLGRNMPCLAVLSFPASECHLPEEGWESIRSSIADRIVVYRRDKPDTTSVLEMEEGSGTRKLFMTVEYDTGGTSRRLQLRRMSSRGTSRDITLGFDSDQIFIGLFLDDKYRIKLPNYLWVLQDAICALVGCHTIQLFYPSRLVFDTRKAT